MSLTAGILGVILAWHSCRKQRGRTATIALFVSAVGTIMALIVLAAALAVIVYLMQTGSR